MKIATWNLQRLDKRKDQQILETIAAVNADILILTETNSIIAPAGYHCISSTPLPQLFDGIKYKDGENRTSIWTRYAIKQRHKTFDEYTNVCADIETPLGILTVYGAIVGVFANKQPRFDNDLNGLLSDLNKLPFSKLCLAGDLNTMFSGYAYPSRKAREILNEGFERLCVTNTTASIPDNVDHIVLSSAILANKNPVIHTWNEDKKLSDHIGVAIDL